MVHLLPKSLVVAPDEDSGHACFCSGRQPLGTDPSALACPVSCSWGPAIWAVQPVPTSPTPSSVMCLLLPAPSPFSLPCFSMTSETTLAFLVWGATEILSLVRGDHQGHLESAMLC